MRRNDREIKDRKEIDAVIRHCRVCRLAMCDGNQPYIVPLSFGYDGCFLYFHSACEGRKIDMIRRNHRVCFEFDILHDMITAEQACRWGAAYESVIGSGLAEMLDTLEAKTAALEWIMRQYGSGTWDFTGQTINKTLVFRVKILEISGKARGRNPATQNLF
jgi:uncharacterized protein